MNLSQLQVAVDRRTGVAIDSAAQVEYINQALQEIAATRDWPWLEATTTFPTVVDQSDYAMPADWLRTRSVVIDSETLVYRSVRDLDEMTSTGTDNARLAWYYGIYGDKLILRPAPGDVRTVTHRYLKTEAALSGASDTPLLPTQFHQAIVDYASYLIFLRKSSGSVVMGRGSVGQAERMMAAYQTWLPKMRRASFRGKGPRTIRKRP